MSIRESKLFIMTIVVLMLLSISLVVVGYASTEKVFQWKITASNSAGTPTFEALKFFSTAVEEASGGRLKIELYPAGTLYAVTEALDAVKAGASEGAITYPDYWVGKEPVLQVINYRPCDPFKDVSEVFYLFDKCENLYKEVFQQLGVTYVSPILPLPGESFQSRVPIRSIEDFKGLRVRSSGLGQDLFHRLGASIVTMPMSEIYTSMKLHTIDAFESSDYEENWRIAYQEVIRYCIEPAPHMPADVACGNILIVNNDAWNTLPDDLKTIVKYCARLTGLNGFEQRKIGKLESRQKFIDYGVEFITLPNEEVAKIKKAAIEVLLKYRGVNSRCDKFIDIYHDVLVDLGYNELAKNFE